LNHELFDDAVKFTALVPNRDAGWAVLTRTKLSAFTTPERQGFSHKLTTATKNPIT
jgi:hypothetical protein